MPTTFDFAWAGVTPGYGKAPGDAAAYAAQYTPKNYTVPIQTSQNPNVRNYTDLMNALNGLNPGDINIDSTASMFTNAALSEYGSNVANQLAYLQRSGRAGVGGYQGILSTLKGGVSDYLSNINKGAEAELGGIQGTLGYYQTLAGRNQLPGQNIMEQNVQAGTANALNRVREFGGSSQGALEAITNLYGQQQNNMRDIGLSAAQYQAQNQQNLAGYMGTVGGQRAGVYNRIGEAELGGASTIAQGQQMLTQAQQQEQNQIANYYGNLAPQTSNFLQGLMQQRLAAEQQQADLARRSILDAQASAGAGLQEETRASDQNYIYNQVQPYMNWANFYSAMMGNQVNPNASADMISQMYQTNNQNWLYNQQGMSNMANQWGNLAGNFLGQYFMNQWYNNGNTGINPRANGGYNYNGNYIGE